MTSLQLDEIQKKFISSYALRALGLLQGRSTMPTTLHKLGAGSWAPIECWFVQDIQANQVLRLSLGMEDV
ncbi:MAG: hypothetical protein LBP35_02025 [Candidatus Ancillula trichonymphae]|nr:hypothetical protein [Candidatus Ancillula trichonymphae]